MISSFLQNPGQTLMNILISIPGILIGLTVHEWAHAFVADKLGDPTAKNLGRMTLNPLAHVDVFGILCLLLVGFGWAKPVPVNQRNFKNTKRDDILVSIAGIVMNLLVAFIFTLLYYVILFKNVQSMRNDNMTSIIMRIISGVFSINLSLAVFNILPIYPLDGSHILDSLLMHRLPKVCVFMHNYGRFILIILLVSGVVSRVLGTVVNWIFSLYSSAALSLIGLFV